MCGRGQSVAVEVGEMGERAPFASRTLRFNLRPNGGVPCPRAIPPPTLPPETGPLRLAGKPLQSAPVANLPFSPFVGVRGRPTRVQRSDRRHRGRGARGGYMPRKSSRKTDSYLTLHNKETARPEILTKDVLRCLGGDLPSSGGAA